MAIETVCKGCARRLRVADEYAGRQARCPHCKTVYTVPGAGDVPHSPPRWRMRGEDGIEYGPITKEDLDGWVVEGRVTANCELQRDGEVYWSSAAELYPSLAPSASKTNPFAEVKPAAVSNPYEAPSRVATMPVRRRFRPHRAGSILTFGILGIVCCQLLGPVAWSMGHADLRQIDAGVMDPGGRSMTQVGMILGIIGTVLLILSVAGQAINLAAVGL